MEDYIHSCTRLFQSLSGAFFKSQKFNKLLDWSILLAHAQNFFLKSSMDNYRNMRTCYLSGITSLFRFDFEDFYKKKLVSTETGLN